MANLFLEEKLVLIQSSQIKTKFMAYKSRWKRRWLSIAIVFAIAIVIYQFFLLPFLLQWGSTEKEFDGYLPGDELMKAKGYKNTLAVTVNASPSQVWPWIA